MAETNPDDLGLGIHSNTQDPREYFGQKISNGIIRTLEVSENLNKQRIDLMIKFCSTNCMVSVFKQKLRKNFKGLLKFS